MKKLNFKNQPILGVIMALLLLSFSKIVFTQTAPVLPRKLFNQNLQAALDQNAQEKINALVQANPFHVAPAINKLLKSALIKQVRQDPDSALIFFNQALILAKAYQKMHGSDVFLKQVDLHQNWSTAAMHQRLKSDSLTAQAIEIAKKGRLTEAIAQLQQAQSILLQLNDTLGYAQCTYTYGVANRHARNWTQAQQAFEGILPIARETADVILEANSLRELGVIAHFTNASRQALTLWQKARALYQKAKDIDNTAIVTTHIATFYKNSGEPRKALQFYDQALELFEETKNLTEKANTINNKGNIYLDFLADYYEAEKCFQTALRIKREIKETLHESTLLGNIGICYKNRGDYFQALKHYDKALKMAQQYSQSYFEAKLLGDIGSVYTEVGNYPLAGSYYQQAANLLKNLGEHKLYVANLTNLAVNYGLSDSTQPAFKTYFEALQQIRAFKMVFYECETLANLGALYATQKAFDRARAYLDSAMIISKKTYNVRQQVEIFLNYADIDYKTNHISRALSTFRQALKLARQINHSEAIWKAYFGVGQCLEKQGKSAAALENYQQAIEVVESMRARLQIATLKTAFMHEKIPVYEAIINLLLKLNRPDEAYDYLERSKARSLLDILNIGPIKILEGIADEYLALKADLEHQQRKIQQELFEAKPTQRDSLQAKLDETRLEYEALLQQIRLNHPRYAELTGVTRPLNRTEVQRQLIQPGTVLMEFLVSEKHTLVWLIGKNLFVCEQVNLPRTTIEAMVNQLLQPFRDVKTGKIQNIADIDFDRQVAQDLYEQLFQPLEAYLQPGFQLIIVPDGILFYLPFEILVTNIENQPHSRQVIFSKFSNTHFLLEKYAFSYVPSASVLARTISSLPSAPLETGSLLAFGNPDFGRFAQTPAKSPASEVFSLIAWIMRSGHSFQLTPLPESAKEVKTIGKLFQPALIYLGQDAKEEKFKQYASQSNIIHLATHCVIEASQPMYSRIVFTQDDDPVEDGFLHTYEVFNLKLNADLVTLDACETGLGPMNRGEGLIGLTRAFMYAGSSSLLVSLWMVSESAGELMTQFYQNLKAGLTKAQALRQAKLTLIQTEGTFKDNQRFAFAHPFLWAPFILIGDWQ